MLDNSSNHLKMSERALDASKLNMPGPATRDKKRVEMAPAWYVNADGQRVEQYTMKVGADGIPGTRSLIEILSERKWAAWCAGKHREALVKELSSHEDFSTYPVLLQQDVRRISNST
jgi:hypothetical protein